MVAVADEGMDGGVGEMVAEAIGIGAGLAVGVDCLFAKRVSGTLSLWMRHDGSDNCRRLDGLGGQAVQAIIGSARSEW